MNPLQTVLLLAALVVLGCGSPSSPTTTRGRHIWSIVPAVYVWSCSRDTRGWRTAALNRRWRCW